MAHTATCKICDVQVPTSHRLKHLREAHGTAKSKWPDTTIDVMFWRGPKPAAISRDLVHRLLTAVGAQYPTCVKLLGVLRELSDAMDDTDELVLQVQPKR